jgi:rhodanese-related sulfurtransferase/DNA-binding transcriptional ArsR family regulator
MDMKTYSDTLYGHFARVGQAVASPQRLRLLELLSQSDRTVETMADRAGMSLANTSQHLRTLRHAGLVSSERDGVFVVYRLAGPDVYEFLSALRALARSRLAAVEHVRREYLESRDGMEHVGMEALIDRIRDGEVTVLDVRPPEEYAAAHVPGAISIPLEDLENRSGSLPRDRDVVAYCRGPYCVLAADAVQLLRSKGFNAICLEDGVLEMQAKGLAMETGD